MTCISVFPHRISNTLVFGIRNFSDPIRPDKNIGLFIGYRGCESISDRNRFWFRYPALHQVVPPTSSTTAIAFLPRPLHTLWTAFHTKTPHYTNRVTASLFSRAEFGCSDTGCCCCSQEELSGGSFFFPHEVTTAVCPQNGCCYRCLAEPFRPHQLDPTKTHPPYGNMCRARGKRDPIFTDNNICSMPDMLYLAICTRCSKTGYIVTYQVPSTNMVRTGNDSDCFYYRC